MDEEYYLMWLLSIEGLGNKKAKALIDRFGTAKNIWRLTRAQLKQIKWLPEKIQTALILSKKTDILEKIIRRTESGDGGRFLSYYNPAYPKLLKAISDAPLGLYIKGIPPGEHEINISIIGSRLCSEYGLTAAFQLSRDLAKKGLTVVSGMARGIDSMAHRGALAGGGRTIAVLGHGLDLCYPPENAALLSEILANDGCAVSEYPPGVPPVSANFPARNRIISGLSQGLVVVEAAQKSGTCITVEQALDQGREIFAVPGNIFSKLSVGANKLIKEGACLVQSDQDILDGLGIDNMNIIKENTITEHTRTKYTETAQGETERAGAEAEAEAEALLKKKAIPKLTADEALIYHQMSAKPVAVDDLSLAVNRSVAVTLGCLTVLELAGLVRCLPGQRYIRVC